MPGVTAVRSRHETTRKQGVRGYAVAEPSPTRAKALAKAQAATQEQEMAGPQAGCDDYVRKPFSHNDNLARSSSIK